MRLALAAFVLATASPTLGSAPAAESDAACDLLLGSEAMDTLSRCVDGRGSLSQPFTHGPSDVDRDVLLSLTALAARRGDISEDDLGPDASDTLVELVSRSRSSKEKGGCVNEFPAPPVDLRSAAASSLSASDIAATCAPDRPRTYPERAAAERAKVRERKAEWANEEVARKVEAAKRAMAKDREVRRRAAAELGAEERAGESFLAKELASPSRRKGKARAPPCDECADEKKEAEAHRRGHDAVMRFRERMERRKEKAEAKERRIRREADPEDCEEETTRETISEDVEKIHEEERRLAKEEKASEETGEPVNPEDEPCDDDSDADENPFRGTVNVDSHREKDCPEGVCINEFPLEPTTEKTTNPGIMKNGEKEVNEKKKKKKSNNNNNNNKKRGNAVVRRPVAPKKSKEGSATPTKDSTTPKKEHGHQQRRSTSRKEEDGSQQRRAEKVGAPNHGQQQQHQQGPVSQPFSK